MSAEGEGEGTLLPEISDDRREIILRELDGILDSPPFRGSKRCQRFLRYTVEKALTRQPDCLKERSIGIEVFGRAPSYDTGDDAIVRVSAKDVRNRLTQYYAGITRQPKVRLALAPGSYLPEFHWDESGGEEAESPAPAPLDGVFRRKFVWVALGTLVVAAAGALLWIAVPAPAERTLRRFWSPILNSPRPVLIGMANPVSYDLEDELVAKRYPVPENSAAGKPAIPPDGIIYGRELIPVTRSVLSTGDAQAAVRLVALFTRYGKPYRLLISAQTSFADLRYSPGILLGGPASNDWAREMMKGCRFECTGEAPYRIRERTPNGRTWSAAGLSEHKVTEDHGLISRVFDQRTGQPFVLLAGVSHFGTAAAAEFVSDPALLHAALRDVRGNWERKNVQVVIRTSVLGETHGSPQFVAIHVW